jgi:hypothetical protein
MGAVPSVDYSALNMLRGLLSEWRSKDLQCLVAEANSMVLELLREQLGHELLQQLPGKELRNQCLTTGSIQSEKKYSIGIKHVQLLCIALRCFESISLL